MSNISLEAAIRTCKVDTAYANKVQSDRFLNPDLMMCPIWNGVDTTGRQVCPDSFYTKNAGCNSAEDRVMVENDVFRPQYMEYINLSANGIDGNIYGNTMPWNEVGQTNAELNAINNVTGNFGLQFGANTYPGCNYYPYEQAVDQEKAAHQAPAKNMYANPQMHPSQLNHLSKAQANYNAGIGGHPQMQHAHTKEGFQNLTGNAVFNTTSQQFAQHQQNFRQQGALNNGFIRNDFRRSGGN